MIVHPELQALRADDSPQRQAQDALYRALGGWRAQGAIAEVQADLAAFATARPMAECPALSALFEEGNPAARHLADSLCVAAATALGAEPLGQVPFRHFTDATISTLLIGRAGGVTLALAAIDGQALAQNPCPVSVNFSPTATWDHVLTGHAAADLIELRAKGNAEAEFHRRTIALSPGRVIAREGSRQALVLGRVAGCLVSLRLTRRQADPQPAREYDLASGRLIHQAAGSARESRHELMVALLGRMGRADAAPVLADMACEASSAALRWQALRECLALDTLAGFRALCTVARSPGDPLAAAAGALRAQLLEAHPGLAEIEPCPV